jgi:hypothetical protein
MCTVLLPPGVCVYMCTVLLPPSDNPIAVNKYIIINKEAMDRVEPQCHRLCFLLYVYNFTSKVFILKEVGIFVSIFVRNKG